MFCDFCACGRDSDSASAIASRPVARESARAEIALAVVVGIAAMAIFGAAVWPLLKSAFSFLAFAVVARGGFLFFRNLSIRNR